MKNKKIIAYVLLATALACSVSGCKKKGMTKEELQTRVNELTTATNSMNDTIKDLKMALANYNPNNSLVQGLDEYISLASDKGAYLALDDKVNIDYPLKIEPYRSIQDETLLYLTSSVKFIPNNNWTINCGSGKMEMSHSSGVYGEVECTTYIGSADASAMYEKYIKPHFDAVKAESVGNSSFIFLADGNFAGSQATGRIKVAKLKDGILHIQEEEVVESTAEEVETDADGNVIETSESSSEASTEESTEASTEITAESVAETVNEAEANAEESSSEPETDADGNIIETSEPEVITQNAEDVLDIQNYLYTVAVAMYRTDEYTTQMITFKFFYPEGDVTDVATKKEFINSTIKSFSINGNSLTLE